jgi:hypothetical protein
MLGERVFSRNTNSFLHMVQDFILVVASVADPRRFIYRIRIRYVSFMLEPLERIVKSFPFSFKRRN